MSMDGARRLLAFTTLAVVLLELTACTTVTRYRGQLAGNSDRVFLLDCADTCKKHAADKQAYVACFVTCPGVQRQEGQACASKDRPPAALCEESRRTDKVATGFAVAGVVTVVGLVVFVFFENVAGHLH